MDINQYKEIVTEANIAFSEVFDRFLSTWGMISQFRTFTTMGIKNTENNYKVYISKIVDEMRPDGFLYGALKDTTSFFESGDNRKFIDNALKQAIRKTSSIIDATALVFGHSILDALLNDYLDIIFIKDPSSYDYLLMNQKVKIEELIDFGKDEILNIKRKRKISNLKRESIVIKSDILHNICSPSHNYNAGGYKFDKNYIENIDNARHNIVHGLTINFKSEEIEEYLDYLFKSAGYYLYMMFKKFDLKIIADPLIREQLKKGLRN